MRISVCCAVYDSGITQSCGVILEFDGDGSMVTRELGHLLIGVDINYARAQALKIALAAIKPIHRSLEVIVHVDNEYVIDVLADNGNEELCGLFNKYDDIQIVHDPQRCDHARRIAKETSESQKHYDSGNICQS